MTHGPTVVRYFFLLFLGISPFIARADFLGPSKPSNQLTLDWRSFELADDLGFDSAGYSFGPRATFAPLLLGLIPSGDFKLAPRFDFSLFKSPGGIDPLLGLGLQGWWLFKAPFYLAPGVGIATAFEASSTKAFPAVTATLGYFLPTQGSGWTSYFSRVFVNYELYLSTITTQEISLGVGFHWEGEK